MSRRLRTLNSLLLLAAGFAQGQTFDLNRRDPASTHAGLFGAGSAIRLQPGSVRVSLLGHGESRPLVARLQGDIVSEVVRSRISTELAAAWAPIAALEVSISVPLVLSQTGSGLTGSLTNFGLASPSVALAWHVLPPTSSFGLAARVAYSVPFSSVDFAHDTWGSVWPSVQLGTEVAGVRLGGEAGARFRARADHDGRAVSGNELFLNAGLGAARGVFRPEGSVRLATGLDTGLASVEVGGAVRLAFAPVDLVAGGALGIGGTTGTPLFRVFAGLAANLGTTTPPLKPVPDLPVDTAPSSTSSCDDGQPHPPQECPELDADGDRIVNRLDLCPSQAEDRDRHADDDGCPDPDNDGDGVIDAEDLCRDVAGMGKHRGCPPPDSDRDGFIDELDRCPAEAGVEELFGCAVKDSDADGIPNHQDNCVTEAGPRNNQGCPRRLKQMVTITREKLVILGKIYFAEGKSKVLPRSFPLLDQLAKVVVGHPEITALAIEGHTDDKGNPEKNRALSLARANSVRAYLLDKGVAPARLSAVGYGPDRPQEPNSSARGREANRRVEFTIINPTPSLQEK